MKKATKCKYIYIRCNIYQCTYHLNVHVEIVLLLIANRKLIALRYGLNTNIRHTLIAHMHNNHMRYEVTSPGVSALWTQYKHNTHINNV